MPGRRVKIAAIILLTSAASLLASEVHGQESGRGIRLGAVLLSPAISSATVGYDSNVFDDAVNPREDLTATFNPDVHVILTAGRNRVKGNTGLNFVYFKEYASERSVGTSNAFNWEFAANRLRPYAALSFTDLTNKPTPEINTRVRNQTKGVVVGTQFRLTPRASLVVEGQRNRTTYDDTARYLGNDLSHELNQTVAVVSGSMWYELTPLTKITVTADAQRQRYDTSGPRDARGYGLVSGVEFAPTALIRGAAAFGYRHLNIAESTVPDHGGLVMTVDLTYVLRGTTRISFGAERDTAPSLVDLQPYYVQTGMTAGITQQLTSVVHVYFTASRQRQDYHRFDRFEMGLIDPLSQNSQSRLQAGTGWRIGRTTSMSVFVESSRRRGGFYGDSKVTRIMAAFTYTL